MTERAQLVRRLLKAGGHTYAKQAGIRLADTPGPLYQLQVVAMLLSARINSSIAVDAARELFAAGLTNPRAMLAASWQDRVDALGRGSYRRYDESTATRLGEGAQLLLDNYGGDLRKLATKAEHDPAAAADLLQQLPGIGPLGADIFLREVQPVWRWLQPYLDDRVAEIARGIGLPHTPRGLASAVGTADLSRVSAALIRLNTNKAVHNEVLGDQAD
jgi:endonuclease III